jgi:aminoglycoside phosphotransferase (APT) family kinase protein
MTPLTADLVRGLISAQFPQWAALPVDPIEPQGWDNRTFRLGADMLVRLPSAAAYVVQVDKERRWLPRLAAHLPVAIPGPVAVGAPTDAFPWPWSVYRWIDGEPATSAAIADRPAFARDTARFLTALRAIDATGGPAAGEHSFFRGAPLAAYDEQTRAAIARLSDDAMKRAALALWSAARATTWSAAPAWVHGDVAPGNLLVREGRLCGVIDFGCLAVGDPACDFAIAWTFFEGESRAAFKQALGLDDATWMRGKAWALWKALILATGLSAGPPRDVAAAQRVLEQVLADGG